MHVKRGGDTTFIPLRPLCARSIYEPPDENKPIAGLNEIILRNQNVIMIHWKLILGN